MGVQVVGRPLSVKEVDHCLPSVRAQAANQVLNRWNRERFRNDPEPLWGDEVEYMLVDVDTPVRRATLFLGQDEILGRWNEITRDTKVSLCAENDLPCLQPEWARYMVESTPGMPYNGQWESLFDVEKSMKRRRDLLKSMLGSSQYPVTMSAFPRLGVSQRFTTPESPFPLPENDGKALASWLCSRLPRYIQLRDQIVARRGVQTEAYIPKYRPEIKTPNVTKLEEDFIRLEGVAYGGGSCSIQTTFQAPNEREARWLHDQLVCLGPAMLALTASTPMHRGYLVDHDCRWSSLAGTLDDRPPTHVTKCEKGHECRDVSSIPHRFSSNQVFVSKDRPSSLSHTCSGLYVDAGVKARLMQGGMDEPLATHFAYILSRSPLLLTRGDTSKRHDPNDMKAFMAFQGVWQHVRLKLPDGDSSGWCVEFRPMEVQLRDSDNAAFSIFMYLVSRAIVTHHLSFYIPLDLVAKSMLHAQKRNAVADGLIWFRRLGWTSPSFTCFACDDHKGDCMQCKHSPAFDTKEVDLLSMDQIINGETAGGFPGLVNIVLSFLRRQNIGHVQLSRLSTYLDIVSQRANGGIPTPAKWMRSFVDAHPQYRGDGKISESVCHDMMVEIAAMNE